MSYLQEIHQDGRQVARGFWTLDKFLCRIELALAFALLFAMIGLSFAMVLQQNDLLDIDTIWIDTLLRVMVMWLGLIGASMATHDNQHISIEIVPRLASPEIKRWIGFAVNVFAAYICYKFSLAAIDNIAQERQHLLAKLSGAGANGSHEAPYHIPEIFLPLYYFDYGVAWQSVVPEVGFEEWQVRLILPMAFVIFTFRFSISALAYLYKVGPGHPDWKDPLEEEVEGDDLGGFGEEESTSRTTVISKEQQKHLRDERDKVVASRKSVPPVAAPAASVTPSSETPPPAAPADTGKPTPPSPSPSPRPLDPSGKGEEKPSSDKTPPSTSGNTLEDDSVDAFIDGLEREMPQPHDQRRVGPSSSSPPADDGSSSSSPSRPPSSQYQSPLPYGEGEKKPQPKDRIFDDPGEGTRMPPSPSERGVGGLPPGLFDGDQKDKEEKKDDSSDGEDDVFS